MRPAKIFFQFNCQTPGLGARFRVAATLALTQSLSSVFGQNNVKVVEKKVANSGKRY